MKKRAIFTAVASTCTALVILKKKQRKKIVTNSPFAFTVEAIEQKPHEITLKWTCENAIYRIYRNDKSIYSGSATTFTDRDLIPGTNYIYTIEKQTRNQQKNEIIKIQTTTAVENKVSENILHDLIITTIISKQQIQIIWEPIDGIDQYQVYKDGEQISIVKEPCFIDNISTNDCTHNYMITAKRPLLSSNVKQSSGKFIISGVIGLLKKNSLNKKAIMETFKFTKSIPPINDILQIKIPEKQINTCKLLYMTFLEEEWIKNPNLLSRFQYFKGDDRQFDPNALDYRTKAEISTNFDDVRLDKSIGETKTYGLTKKLKKVDKASDEGIELTNIQVTEDTVSFILKHCIKNPIIISPAIDYQVQAIYTKTGFYNISGTHDQSPNHEIYLKQSNYSEWEPIHLMKSKGLDHMSNITPNTFWHISNFSL